MWKINDIYKDFFTVSLRKKKSYFTVSWRWIRSFFSICSMGNCGTSYGAEISFGNSWGANLPDPPSLPNTGLSLPVNRKKKKLSELLLTHTFYS